jgi:hypothetical protein
MGGSVQISSIRLTTVVIIIMFSDHKTLLVINWVETSAFAAQLLSINFNSKMPQTYHRYNFPKSFYCTFNAI